MKHVYHLLVWRRLLGVNRHVARDYAQQHGMDHAALFRKLMLRKKERAAKRRFWRVLDEAIDDLRAEWNEAFMEAHSWDAHPSRRDP